MDVAQNAGVVVMLPQRPKSEGLKWLAIGLAILSTFLCFDRARAGDLAAARAWYKTLGFPDVTDLPYVRVYTGGIIYHSNQPAARKYAEGFLLSDSPEAFTVFVCSVSHFDGDEADDFWQMRAPPSIQRFTRREDEPDWRRSGTARISYEKLDFPEAAKAALERARDQGTRNSYIVRRARKFAFAQACRQQGLPEIAAELEQIVEQIPGKGTSRPDPARALEFLQQDLGDTVLENAELLFVDLSLSWQDLLTPYEHFAEFYPGNDRCEYARKTAALLRQTIEEEAHHHPKPYAEMMPVEKAAENVYQLRNLQFAYWTAGRYPIVSRMDSRKPDLNAPEDRLIDLGDAAIPALIEAMNDQHFTRSQYAEMLDYGPPKTVRVGEVAQRLLEHIAHRSFYPSQNGDVRLTCRQIAEQWWAEKQRRKKTPNTARR